MSQADLTRLETRCDSCVARATYWIIFANGHDLRFCEHHRARHMDALSANPNFQRIERITTDA